MVDYIHPEKNIPQNILNIRAHLIFFLFFSFFVCTKQKKCPIFATAKRKQHYAFNMVVVAQLVRALDCGSRGRRFETGLPPQIKSRLISRLIGFIFYILFAFFYIQAPGIRLNGHGIAANITTNPTI